MPNSKRTRIPTASCDPVESSGLTIKAVSQNTALLYMTLRDSGKLPGYARAVGGENYETAIARLVIDQILEIEDGDAFVSGAPAYELFYGMTVNSDARTRIGQLSIAALQYGQALGIGEIEDLSMRLYNYHRIPISGRWEQVFAGPEKVAEFWGLDAHGRHRRVLDGNWKESYRTTDGNSFRADPVVAGVEPPPIDRLAFLGQSTRADAPSATGATYKLYISPLPQFIDEAFDSR